jgi:excisionase family DNA binding protein
MENTSSILTIKEVAQILRVSKAHVHNVLGGKVAGVPKLTHLTLGRRRLVRREWLDQWLEASRTR